MKIRALIQVLVAATIVGVNLVACGPTKVAQCNLLSSEINQAAGLGKKFEAVGKELEANGRKVKDIEGFHRMAKEGAQKVTALVTELDGFTAKVKGVELKDEKLVGVPRSGCNDLFGRIQIAEGGQWSARSVYKTGSKRGRQENVGGFVEKTRDRNGRSPKGGSRRTEGLEGV